MEIYGKHYGFLFTVGAAAEISKHCKNGDIANIGELLNGDFAHVYDGICKLAIPMNKAYESMREQTEASYRPCYLNEKIIGLLNIDEVTDFADEITEAIQSGMEQTIKAKPKN